eukprot:Gregarina_sp_Poly_1__11231@NODE_925_length_5688_cov_92_671233_g658_i0_p2_GENE_NODE_925_length_5688_cov_92_671233_g658_i0NODE_925_length_5688_cov_92_671233_g658_i0_p2_ORF_typecomplete_len539_score46_85Fbox/PF00646_33/0_094_NODE_925_length_5688_cov_92_671233_g658_i09692585
MENAIVLHGVAECLDVADRYKLSCVCSTIRNYVLSPALEVIAFKEYMSIYHGHFYHETPRERSSVGTAITLEAAVLASVAKFRSEILFHEFVDSAQWPFPYINSWLVFTLVSLKWSQKHQRSSLFDWCVPGNCKSITQWVLDDEESHSQSNLIQRCLVALRSLDPGCIDHLFVKQTRFFDLLPTQSRKQGILGCPKQEARQVKIASCNSLITSHNVVLSPQVAHAESSSLIVADSKHESPISPDLFAFRLVPHQTPVSMVGCSCFDDLLFDTDFVRIVVAEKCLPVTDIRSTQAMTPPRDRSSVPQARAVDTMLVPLLIFAVLQQSRRICHAILDPNAKARIQPLAFLRAISDARYTKLAVSPFGPSLLQALHILSPQTFWAQLPVSSGFERDSMCAAESAQSQLTPQLTSLGLCLLTLSPQLQPERADTQPDRTTEGIVPASLLLGVGMVQIMFESWRTQLHSALSRCLYREVKPLAWAEILKMDLPCLGLDYYCSQNPSAALYIEIALNPCSPRRSPPNAFARLYLGFNAAIFCAC